MEIFSRNTLINCCVVNVVSGEVRGRNFEAYFSKLTLLMEKWERIMKLNKEESPHSSRLIPPC